MAGELAEQEARLPQRRRDHHGRPPCSTVQAALRAATVLLPLCRVALSSSRGDTESSTSGCQGSSVSPAMRSAQTMGLWSVAD